MFSDESFLPACSKEMVPFHERNNLINPVESNPNDFSLLTADFSSSGNSVDFNLSAVGESSSSSCKSTTISSIFVEKLSLCSYFS